MSRLSDEEFSQLLGVPRDAAEKTLAARPEQPNDASPQKVYSYPSTVNWRNQNGYDWTTSIKSQAPCGSCSAFASAGAIESRMEIVNNNPYFAPNLAESHLYYCNGGNCEQGIYIQTALQFAQDTGIVDESCYSYPDPDNTCSPCSDWQSRVSKINSWTTVYNTGDIKQAIADGGPVVADMDVYEDFSAYIGGIYQHTWGKYAGFHAVVLVGYDDPGGYWIAKNSWDMTWGEDGWFRIVYGEGGIDDYAFVPSLGGSIQDTHRPRRRLHQPVRGHHGQWPHHPPGRLGL